MQEAHFFLVRASESLGILWYKFNYAKKADQERRKKEA